MCLTALHACGCFLSCEFSGFLRDRSEEQRNSEGEPLGRKTKAAGCQFSLAQLSSHIHTVLFKLSYYSWNHKGIMELSPGSLQGTPCLCPFIRGCTSTMTAATETGTFAAP
ncbi:unnamed protein product [Gulo gulo]|uniref:Uncharacterized protein n=1 Tax=Gulo gulo TaxID=48420 RepID=A0A9X9PXA4_GULGU|nr:unnamed protein product [Gulo gulo]